MVLLPKQKPVDDLSKHLRPILLTPVISTIADDFVVSAHVGRAVLQIIDPDQYGSILRSSTLYALISMIHHWSQATDATGAAIRVVLFAYRKAFDLIDHSLLIMIMNLHSVKTIEEYSKALYIKLKLKFKISKN